MRAFLGVSVTDESGANAHRSQPVEEGTEAARYRGCAPLRPQAYLCSMMTYCTIIIEFYFP